MKTLFYIGLISTFFYVFTHGNILKTPQAQFVTNTIQAFKNTTLAEKLGLTDQQKTLLHTKRAQYRLTNAQIDAAIVVKKTELENELDQPDPNQKKLTRLCQQIGVLYGKKMKDKIHFVMNVEEKILTPVQLTKLEDSPAIEKDPTMDLALSK